MVPPGDDWILDPSHPVPDPDGGVRRLRVFLRPHPYLHQQIQTVTRYVLADLAAPPRAQAQAQAQGGTKLGGGAAAGTEKKKELTPRQNAMLAAMRRRAKATAAAK